MKKILMITLLALLAAIAQAQVPNTDEWLKQKKTQKKYLAKQIVALKVFLKRLKKGYQIVQRGLYTIDNIKQGNFNLHSDFFNSLNHVNPHIARSAKVADIIAYQVYIIRDFKAIVNRCKRDGNLTPEELYYLSRVYTNLMRSCDVTLAQLHETITNGKRQMTDDERIREIDRLHTDMKDKHAFVRTFGNETRMLSASRGKEQREAQLLKALSR